MLNLISKDILMQKKNLLLILLFILGENIYIHFISGYPMIFISVLVPFAAEYFLLTNSCLFDDKNKSYIILNSLPVTRKSVVIAKYISSLVFFAIGICLQLIFAALININKYGIMKIEYIIICFCFIAILSSVYLPIYFKSGYAKTKWPIMILFFAMYLGISSINNHNLIKMIKVFTSMSYWTLCGSALLISIILMVISLFVSAVFYNSREFSD